MCTVYRSKYKAGRKYIPPSILLMGIWGFLQSKYAQAVPQHLKLGMVGRAGQLALGLRVGVLVEMEVLVEMGVMVEMGVLV